LFVCTYPLVPEPRALLRPMPLYMTLARVERRDVRRARAIHHGRRRAIHHASLRHHASLSHHWSK